MWWLWTCLPPFLHTFDQVLDLIGRVIAKLPVQMTAGVVSDRDKIGGALGV